MWPALEGFILILAFILIFGIISLPPRSKKKAQSYRGVEIIAGAGVDQRPSNTNEAFRQSSFDAAGNSNQRVFAAPESAKGK